MTNVCDEQLFSMFVYTVSLSHGLTMCHMLCD